MAAPTCAQDGAAEPTGSQTFTMTLLHKQPQPTWSDIDIEHGPPLIGVLINGQSVCGMIDTGADSTVVDIAFAKSQGLDVLASTKTLKTASDTIPTARVIGVPVELQGQFSFKADLVGVDMPAFTCPAGGQLTFVLGLDILRSLSVGIDAPRRKVIFVKTGSITPRGDDWARFEWTDGLVAGTVNGMAARMRVDTGSSSLVLVPANRFETFFAGMEVVDLGGSIDGAGPKENNVGIRDIPVSLGNLTVRSEAKRISEDKGPEDANLGFPFFIWTFTIFDAGQNLIAMRLPEVSK